MQGQYIKINIENDSNIKNLKHGLYLMKNVKDLRKLKHQEELKET